MRRFVFLFVVLSFSSAHAGIFDSLNGKEAKFFKDTPALLTLMTSRLSQMITVDGLKAEEKAQYQKIVETHEEYCPFNRISNYKQQDCDKISEEISKYESAVNEAQSQEQTKKDKERLAKEQTERDSFAKAEQDQRNKSMAEDAAYKASPDGITESYCEERINIKTYQADIAHEKEIARRSGIINQSAMYYLTRNLMDTEINIKKLTLDYKALTGRSLSPKNCQLKN